MSHCCLFYRFSWGSEDRCPVPGVKAVFPGSWAALDWAVHLVNRIHIHTFTKLSHSGSNTTQPTSADAALPTGWAPCHVVGGQSGTYPQDKGIFVLLP